MPAETQPLTAAVLTPVGRGAVATIRVCRTSAAQTAAFTVDASTSPARINSAITPLNGLFRAANGKALDSQPLRKILFGQWGHSNPEDIVVCRLAADLVEIHCHGGDAAVRRVLTDLATAGCAVISWQEQTALSADELEAECLDVLSRTSTWRTTRIALEQSTGLLRTTLSRLATDDSLPAASVLDGIDALLRWAGFGLHLSSPWSVVLTGRPNVGKSSLINALLGYQRAIVFNEPGTTRDVVTAETAFEGWPVVLADTAGIRDTTGVLESAGIALARERLRTADLRLVLLDINQPPTADDFALLAEWPDALIVAHKSDLPDNWGARLPVTSIKVSSGTGSGMSELQRELIHRLIPTAPPSGTPMAVTVNQIQLLRRARDATTPESRRRILQDLEAGFALGGDHQGRSRSE
jgi:tRNA modification GTPase